MDLSRRYTWRSTKKEAEILAQAFEGVVCIDSAGCSVKGRDLFYLKIGKGSRNLFLVGVHHGREYIGAAYLMQEVRHLISRMFREDTSHIFEKFTFFIMPMANPDGAQISITKGRLQGRKIKKMQLIHSGYDTWKANANGVDLNRNYPRFFEEKYSSVTEPASEMYKGEYAASEPEVRSIIKLCRENDFEAAITFHAKGEEIYYGDDSDILLAQQTYPLAKALADHTGYELMIPSKDPKIYGAGFENWFRAEFNKPCILIELAPYIGGPHPFDMNLFDEKVWSKTKDIPLIMAEYLIKNSF